MQTNFHAQLQSLIAMAIGTLRERIEAHSNPETKVLTVKGYYHTFNANTQSVEVTHERAVTENGLITKNGIIPFEAMHPAQLLKLIDEVTANAN